MNPQKNNSKMSRQSRNQTENRKTPTWQFVVIGILLIILFYLIMKVFSINQSNSPNDLPSPTDSVVQTTDTTDTTDSTKADTTESMETTESSSEAESSTADEKGEGEEETTLEETTPSDDLVIKAYTGQWEPVPTSQTEPHTATNFSDGSADRKELKQAAAKATGVPETDMIEWWVGNNGPNKVVSTISNKKQDVIYRVYSEWVEGKGWKPTKIEELKENDRR